MKLDKDNAYAVCITIAVHIAILIILLLNNLTTVIPFVDSDPVIQFGDVFASISPVEPRTSVTQQVIPPPQTHTTPANEDLLTQDVEQTTSIPNTKKAVDDTAAITAARRTAAAAEQQQRELAQQQRLKEQQQQSENINNLANKAFGQGDAQDANRGEQDERSDVSQGNPFASNNEQTAYSTTDGFGSFNLNGRSLRDGSLPRPDYNSQQDGKIVINITVDPNGNVISALIGKETNIDDARLRESASDAARRAKFNKVKSSNNQSGTITYIFKLI
jgi:TonB family protein